jgi:two-component system, LytTR family, sensor kinase
MSARTRRKVGAAVLYFGTWTVLALLAASQSIITYAYMGDGVVNRVAVLKVTLPLWLIWSVLALAVIGAARRWPIAPGVWKRRIALHAALNLVFAIVVIALYRQARALLGLPSQQPYSFELITGLQTQVLTYWIVVGLDHVVMYYRRARDREVKTAELSAELSDARLDALRMQLHPHFLFNTMHAISSAIREDPEGAENMLAELAELLRTTVDSSATHEVPLREEMAFIERYVAIQRVRFGDRLQVVVDVDHATHEALVPTLILQPLVENAIEHGIATRRRGGRLEIRAAARAGNLELSVADDGAGLTDAQQHADTARVGLRNTRARLAHLYGERGRLDLRNRTDGGVVATVVLPYRFSAGTST